MENVDGGIYSDQEDRAVEKEDDVPLPFEAKAKVRFTIILHAHHLGCES